MWNALLRSAMRQVSGPLAGQKVNEPKQDLQSSGPTDGWRFRNIEGTTLFQIGF